MYFAHASLLQVKTNTTNQHGWGTNLWTKRVLLSKRKCSHKGLEFGSIHDFRTETVKMLYRVIRVLEVLYLRGAAQ